MFTKKLNTIESPNPSINTVEETMPAGKNDINLVSHDKRRQILQMKATLDKNNSFSISVSCKIALFCPSFLKICHEQ
jgi:hypothetical protein